jgi:hypothetical protein
MKYLALLFLIAGLTACNIGRGRGLDGVPVAIGCALLVVVGLVLFATLGFMSL